MALSPGAKMLKKAMSLKTELRDKIIKRQPSSLTGNQASGDGGFSKQCKTAAEKTPIATDRLPLGVSKVNQALMYAGDVVHKKTLTMLPGTATVVLETVQELLQMLHHYYHTANREEYTVHCADLYGAIAKLMRLSDAHVLHSDRELDSYELLAAIQSIQDTISLLTSHCIEKNELVPVTTPTSDRSSDVSSSFLDSCCATGEFESCDGANSFPPRKPPLPFDYESQLAKLNVTTTEPRESFHAPPPLPQKVRTKPGSMTSAGAEQTAYSTMTSTNVASDDPCTVVANRNRPGSSSQFGEPSPIDILERMRTEMRSDIGETLTRMWVASNTPRSLMSGVDSELAEFSQTAENPSTDSVVENEQIMQHALAGTALGFSHQTGQLLPLNNISSLITTSSVQTYSFQQRIVKSGDGMEKSQSQTSSHIVTKMGRADVSASYVQSYLSEFAGKKDSYLFQVDVEGQGFQGHAGDRLKTTHDFIKKIEGVPMIDSVDHPPPLPLKKKHIDIYMLAFGGAPTMLDFAQSQTQFQDFYRERFEKQRLELAVDNSSNPAHDSSIGTDDDELLKVESHTNPAPFAIADYIETPGCCSDKNVPIEPVLGRSDTPCEVSSEDFFDENEILISTDVWPYVSRIVEDEMESVKSGSVDALVALAASVSNREFLFQEAFLTTYITFIHAGDLIDKLLRRYSHFSTSPQPGSKRFCRSTFSLLIRVVDEMGALIGDDILDDLFYLVFCLISDGELILAKCLRKTVLKKCEMKKKLLEAKRNIALLPSIQLTLRTTSVLDFKAHVLAEQMTLIDNELFQNIEISELLRYSREQQEELSPNLTKFTEHFNKMSFWCRSRIMEREDPRDREKLMIKFYKIMKFLRKLKNFHSYLALLSAVDSAPVRRLDWSKQVTESSAELSDIIDSSSSFRKYRNTLTETQPPCIPYIGLILQDLTFVHIGNPDKMSNGEVNFSKRWQLFHILEGLRRFKSQCYDVPRDANVIMFFNGFGDHLSEEVLWQLSEDYKPRKGSNKDSV